MAEKINLLQLAQCCFQDNETGADFYTLPATNGQKVLVDKFNAANGTSCVSLQQVAETNAAGYSLVHHEILANTITEP